MVVPDKKRLQYLSWLTLFGMSAMGILLISYMQKKGVRDTLLGGKAYYLQGLVGLFFGTLSALLALLLMNGRRFRNVRQFFENLMHEINPSLFEILFYSFCASVGEEVLFRAGIQPLIGIWPAAFAFVLLHGYINPSNVTLTIYGLLLVVICSGFGYIFKLFGLSACIVAHFVYDVSMFSILKYSYTKQTEPIQAE
jgi:membrane protease YdiL (CAAX protease family)